MLNTFFRLIFSGKAVINKDPTVWPDGASSLPIVPVKYSKTNLLV